MDAERRGHGVLAALLGAAGVFIVGLAGSEALFAPASEGLSLETTLIPSGLAALGMFGYLLTGSAAEAEAPGEIRPRTPLRSVDTAPAATESRPGARAA